MLCWRLNLSSVGTFIKHLTTPKPNTKKFTTRLSCCYLSNFEALSSRQKQQIHVYVDSLLQWNQKMNLTAVTEVNEVMKRHVEDSLAIIPPIQESYLEHCNDSCSNIRLVDVGSGAGLPGLILAIACPDWKVMLLESINKRCVFLEHAVETIGLPNVQVTRGRAEAGIASLYVLVTWGRGQDFGRNPSFREQFDVAVARAVAEMRILSEYCLPLVRVGGLFVAAKGHDPHEETKTAEKAIQAMGATVLQISSVESHSPYGQRTAVVCLKSLKTPRKYPRDPGTPTKLPL